MSEICTKCGLPKELCVCESIAKESQEITAKLEKRKFGKKYTVVKGINQHEVDLKDVAKKLKAKFACGGTAKDGMVELQGNHIKSIKRALIDLGFPPGNINIK
ncbi:MAG: translation initiation factor [archaeon]